MCRVGSAQRCRNRGTDEKALATLAGIHTTLGQFNILFGVCDRRFGSFVAGLGYKELRDSARESSRSQKVSNRLGSPLTFPGMRDIDWCCGVELY